MLRLGEFQAVQSAIQSLLRAGGGLRGSALAANASAVQNLSGLLGAGRIAFDVSRPDGYGSAAWQTEVSGAMIFLHGLFNDMPSSQTWTLAHEWGHIVNGNNDDPAAQRHACSIMGARPGFIMFGFGGC